MKYYRRNPGDYLSATGHLTLVEHGAYNVLMDTYYATENALPADPKALYRIAGAHTALERAAVDRVTREFFTPDGDVLVQSRIEIEIAAGREKSQKLAANGSKGGDARAKNIEAKAVANAQAIAIANAKQKPKHIHQPSTITKPDGLEKPAATPLPDWLDSSLWESWRQERKARRKTMTPKAETEGIAVLDALRQQGQDPAAVIRQSIANGWTGLFAVKTSNNGPPSETAKQREARELFENLRRSRGDDHGSDSGTTGGSTIDGTAERVD